MGAIKKIANAFDNHMDAKRTLREIKLLRHLDHENVLGLRDVIPPPVRREFNGVYIATELMETDLHRIICSNQSLSEEHCQYFLYQILRGLKYIHSANIIHRDLKPSNLLLNANCDLKIGDFGLARPTLQNDFRTEYVLTRCYRAPELLLNSLDYNSAIDVWSVGCIFMELINKKPLFPGRDHVHQMRLLTELMNKKPLFPGRDHVHQMRLLTELLGTPTEADLGLVKNEDVRRYIQQLPQYPRQPLARVFPHVHPLATDLIDRMLTIDHTRRITVEDALAHPYLANLHDVADEPSCHQPFSFDFEQQPLQEEQIKDVIYKEALALNPKYG